MKTNYKDAGFLALLRLTEGGPCWAPHEWVFIGCLRGIFVVISRGLARFYDRGRRERTFVRGEYTKGNYILTLTYFTEKRNPVG